MNTSSEMSNLAQSATTAIELTAFYVYIDFLYCSLCKYPAWKAGWGGL